MSFSTCIFFNTGEDVIERWHQIRVRHYARIRSIMSLHRQKSSQAKYEHAHCNVDIKNAITKVNEETKRNFKKNHIPMKTKNTSRNKSIRVARRNKVKREVEEETRRQMLTHRERDKQSVMQSLT